MISRCTSHKDAAFERYGGRGINVCDRWRHSFENFLSDMGPCPPGLTLERKDNDGNYEPGNCKWATQKDQQNNRRNNRRFDFNGETKTLAQWADKFDLDWFVLRSRIDRGWCLEDALSIRPRKHNIVFTFSGKSKTLKDWAKTMNVNYSMLVKRLNSGWSLAAALTNKSQKEKSCP